LNEGAKVPSVTITPPGTDPPTGVDCVPWLRAASSCPPPCRNARTVKYIRFAATFNRRLPDAGRAQALCRPGRRLCPRCWHDRGFRPKDPRPQTQDRRPESARTILSQYPVAQQEKPRPQQCGRGLVTNSGRQTLATKCSCQAREWHSSEQSLRHMLDSSRPGSIPDCSARSDQWPHRTASHRQRRRPRWARHR
jgi:hypothetical protein